MDSRPRLPIQISIYQNFSRCMVGTDPHCPGSNPGPLRRKLNTLLIDISLECFKQSCLTVLQWQNNSRKLACLGTLGPLSRSHNRTIIQPVKAWHVVSIPCSPAFVGFIYRNYHYISVACKLRFWVGTVLYTIRKFFSNLESNQSRMT